jgi:UDP-N-acetylmuramate dehydrogenase
MHSMFINIKDITTMQLPAMANVFSIQTIQDIEQFFKDNPNTDNQFILGGGSNLIIAPSLKDRPVLKMEILGIDIVSSDDKTILVKIGSGENWDSIVEWAVNNNYSGIEALSAIPGTVGAAPVQNIGAYGSEIKDVLDSVDVYDIKEKKFVNLKNSDCNFSYRNSIFKSTQKGRYIITNVTIHLSKNQIKIPQYKGVQEYFEMANNLNPSLSDIRKAIIEIRWSKLPQPQELPNCGSFFENPIVDSNIAETLKSNYPDLPIYPYGSQHKVSAGYLIDKSGLKGAKTGPVGTYEKNALVIVNHGGATYDDILQFKDQIIKTVYDKFGVTLKPEPEFVG